MDLKKYIRSIPDYPKKGILFRDITTLIKNPEAFKFANDKIIEKAKKIKFDKERYDYWVSVGAQPSDTVMMLLKRSQMTDEEIAKLEFKDPKNILISNVTAKEVTNASLLKDLLIKQIESIVRWRESVMFMINKGVNKFIEIGPGKVLSGLIKRIDKNVKVSAINNKTDIENIKI